MSNGDDQQTCCILDACCGGEKAIAELAEWLQKHVKSLNAKEAMETAQAIKGDHGFDLAPKGTIQGLIDFVAAQVRLHPTYED